MSRQAQLGANDGRGSDVESDLRQAVVALSWVTRSAELQKVDTSFLDACSDRLERLADEFEHQLWKRADRDEVDRWCDNPDCWVCEHLKAARAALAETEEQ